MALESSPINGFDYQGKLGIAADLKKCVDNIPTYSLVTVSLVYFGILYIPHLVLNITEIMPTLMRMIHKIS